MSWTAKRPLLVGTVILVFLWIFTKSQASSPFEALKSVHLSKCQRDVRPSVQKTLRTMSFSTVSTGDSDIPSSCEMKDDPAFMHCRESRLSFGSGHLGVHSTWGSKHRVALTCLFLREGSSWGACGTLAYVFSQSHGIILIPRQYGVHGSFLKLLYKNWWSSILETFFSGNLSCFLKGVKKLVLYDLDRGMVMDPMQGKLASSQFDLWYTKIFCVPEVTSVFFSSCDSVVEDYLEFNHANRGSLRVWLGKRNCSGHNVGESGLISRRGGSLMGFVELWQEPGVYSPVTARMYIRNCSWFREVRTPVYVWWTPWETKLVLAG